MEQYWWFIDHGVKEKKQPPQSGYADVLRECAHKTHFVLAKIGENGFFSHQQILLSPHWTSGYIRGK